MPRHDEPAGSSGPVGHCRWAVLHFRCRSAAQQRKNPLLSHNKFSPFLLGFRRPALCAPPVGSRLSPRPHRDSARLCPKRAERSQVAARSVDGSTVQDLRESTEIGAHSQPARAHPEVPVVFYGRPHRTVAGPTAPQHLSAAKLGALVDELGHTLNRDRTVAVFLRLPLPPECRSEPERNLPPLVRSRTLMDSDSIGSSQPRPATLRQRSGGARSSGCREDPTGWHCCFWAFRGILSL